MFIFLLPKGSETLPISFIIYGNDKLFPSTNLTEKSSNAEDSKRVIGSRIISATIERVPVVYLPPTNPVKLYFTINQVGRFQDMILSYEMFLQHKV